MNPFGTISLPDSDGSLNPAVQDARFLLQAFQGADGAVEPLDDAPGLKIAFQSLQYQGKENVNPEAVGFKDENVLEPVDHKTGQKIRFAEKEPERILPRVQCGSQAPRLFDPP
jgi:hypothetical protein